MQELCASGRPTSRLRLLPRRERAGVREVCNGWLAFRTRSLSLVDHALNLLGSIAFGVAALASLVQPSTDEPVSARAIANAGTAVAAPSAS